MAANSRRAATDQPWAPSLAAAGALDAEARGAGRRAAAGRSRRSGAAGPSEGGARDGVVAGFKRIIVPSN